MVVIPTTKLEDFGQKHTDTKIRNEREYKVAMKNIESLLNKATEAGGFHKLPAEEATMLDHLSKTAEAYEDNTLKLMPIVPKTLREA